MDENNKSSTSVLNPVQTNDDNGQNSASPVGIAQKEYEGISDPADEEFIKPSESEPTPPNEVSSIIEKKSELPKLTPEDAKIGIKLAKESTPVQTSPQIIKLIEEVELESKGKDGSNNSIVWLKELLKKIVKQFKLRQ